MQLHPVDQAHASKRPRKQCGDHLWAFFGEQSLSRQGHLLLHDRSLIQRLRIHLPVQRNSLRRAHRREHQTRARTGCRSHHLVAPMPDRVSDSDATSDGLVRCLTFRLLGAQSQRDMAAAKWHSS